MAFVLEKIPQVDKERLSFDIVSPDRWCVDRARDMFFVNTGGGGMTNFTRFELHCGGQVVKMLVDRSLTDARASQRDTTYTINRVDVPFALKPKAVEIKLAIEECLTKFGYFGNPEKMGVITIKNLDESKIFFVQENRSDIERLTAKEFQPK